jgi:hypothetical protein
VLMVTICLTINLQRLYSRVKNGLLPRIRTFREITFFMLCVTRIFKSYFECLRLVTLNWEFICNLFDNVNLNK